SPTSGSGGQGDLGAVVVDPRFRARRIAVRKGAGRRRLNRLVVLVLVAVLALTAVIVLKSPILDVDEVAVTGARAVDAEAVIEATGVQTGSALLLVDLDAVQRAVEALPWVEEASVARDLPGALSIDIIERTPAAIGAADDGASVLVDPDGHVLGSADPAAFPASVPAIPTFVRVVATDAPPAPGGRVDASLLEAIALAERLRGDPANVVAAVHLEPTLRLELAGGGIVDFGDADGVDGKVDAFRTIHARVDQACLELLDLRVPTRPVLTRDEPCS
ncbi:MAG: FtsQ-type POTRA domain-containing protein, partial [Acidimicrobiales bacterium]|nr:FtsQ-type POTRA domain-containing protein [Acidimicrobiales bacterium]